METIRPIPGTSSEFPFSSLPPTQLPSPFLRPLPKAQLTHKPRQTQQKEKGTFWPAVALRLFSTMSPFRTCTGLPEVSLPLHVSHNRSCHPSWQDLCL